MYMLLKSLVGCMLLVGSTAWGFEDSMAAVVGEKVITESQLKKSMRLFKKMIDPKLIQGKDDAAFRNQILDHIIDVSVQLNVAERAGVTLTEQEKKTMRQNLADQRQAQVADLEEHLRSEGVDPKAFFSHFEEQMLVQKIQQMAVGSQVKVTERELQQVRAEFEERLTEYFVEDIVFENIAKSDSLKQSKQAAKSLTVSWATGTHNKWNVPKGSRMIQFKWKKLAEMPVVFQSHIKALTQGACAQPLLTESGVHVLKLIKKRQANGMPTEAQLKEYVFGQSMHKEVSKWIADLKQQQYIAKTA